MAIDFFISYASPDVVWAEWVGWVLEDGGASVVMQAWDFAPGSNFVIEMQRAAASARRTIAILSPDYLKSSFAAPEWAAAFAQDPEGTKRSLVPVRVRECPLEGMLRTIVHINLVRARSSPRPSSAAAGHRPRQDRGLFGGARHQHEYRVLQKFPLADDQIIAAGVIDDLTGFVEHPEVVADRLENVARAVGDPRRVMACTDCGFDTSAGMGRVTEDVVWAKLAAMAEGARIATQRLF